MTGERVETAELFRPHLDSVFTLRAEGVELPVTLTSCKENPLSSMPGGIRTAFSLVLECPAETAPAFNGGSFMLHHPVVGAVGPVHVERILPTFRGPDKAVFEVVFN